MIFADVVPTSLRDMSLWVMSVLTLQKRHAVVEDKAARDVKSTWQGGCAARPAQRAGPAQGLATSAWLGRVVPGRFQAGWP